MMVDLSERKTQVALFLHHLGGGGAERVMLNLAIGMARQGIAVDMVLSCAAGRFLPQVPGAIRVVDLGARRTLTSVPALVGYLRHVRPAVLLSAMEHVNLCALAARRLAGGTTRVVITEHSVHSKIAAHDRSWKGRLQRMLMRRWYPSADMVVAVSHGVAETVSEMFHVPPSRLHVIYNPVIDGEFLAKSRQPVDHPWFRPGQPKVILAVGNLSPWKDFATLLKAFAGLCKAGPLRLMILGEGPERGALETLSRELGIADDVEMPGFIENPYAYMAQAAVLVLSSRWEAAPTVLVEAMALGIPIVSTDCDFGPRELLAGGKFGRLVPLGDPEALATGVVEALANGPQPVPADFLDQFRIETSTQQYLRLLASEAYA
jgi:glycosyltransferase involved in cell wall biosynthesis